MKYDELATQLHRATFRYSTQSRTWSLTCICVVACRHTPVKNLSKSSCKPIQDVFMLLSSPVMCMTCNIIFKCKFVIKINPEINNVTQFIVKINPEINVIHCFRFDRLR